MRRCVMTAAIAMAVALPFAGLAVAMQTSDDSDDEVIQYLKTASHDPIVRLQKEIDAGRVRLDYESDRGYLKALLKELRIPISSQMLVFSKTSFQRDLIDPYAPRALYFNDNTFVGYVQGSSLVEVSTLDPQLGAVFYILDQHKGERPRFVRQSYECLQCHTSAMTGGVPGQMMRSVYAHADGQPDFASGTYLTTDQSPLRERWGGWYVTGKHGAQRHMGNGFVQGASGTAAMDMDKGANITNLSRYIDPTHYLGRYSDIVALMVAEHQTHLQNLITKASYHTRIALRYEQMLNKELNRPPDYRAESTMSRIKSVCEPLVKAMLFVGEEPLTEPITGMSGFAEQFAAQGPHDKQQRSLRQLDLKRRLLRYPCSYLIYSEAFDGLPSLAKQFVYQRLWEVLSGKDTSADFARLSPEDRRNVLEILRDTKPEFVAGHPERL